MEPHTEEKIKIQAVLKVTHMHRPAVSASSLASLSAGFTERPGTEKAWAGSRLPQPRPSLLTRVSVLPGSARALTTNHPSTEVEENLCAEVHCTKLC